MTATVLSAIGSASVLAQLTNPSAFNLAEGKALGDYRIPFTVDETGLYRLEGTVSVALSGEGSASAFISLAGPSTISANAFSGGPASDSIPLQLVTLTAGTPYRVDAHGFVEAKSRVFEGSPEVTGSYSYSISLTPIPEPSTSLLLAAGLAALAVRRRSMGA